MPIARGPGAADIAITPIFGLNMLLHFSAQTAQRAAPTLVTNDLSSPRSSNQAPPT
jgi:hypothetical protein